MHILLNNLIKLALGPSLIKYDYDSVQILKMKTQSNIPQLESIWGHKPISV